MTQTSDSADQQRLRRPKPVRKAPRRNILGVFNQKGAPAGASQPYTTPANDSHPLGFSMEDDAPERISPATRSLDDEDLKAAAKLIDDHIREGEKYSIPLDGDWRQRMSSLVDGLDAGDLAKIAKTLTQSYAEVAAVWVDLAGQLRGLLGEGIAMRGAQGTQSAATSPGGTLVVQSARKVSAKLRMFEAGPATQAQPLLLQDGSGTVSIMGLSVEADQINLHVPYDAPLGTYHGLLLSADSTPVGAVTLTIPATGS